MNKRLKVNDSGWQKIGCLLTFLGVVAICLGNRITTAGQTAPNRPAAQKNVQATASVTEARELLNQAYSKTKNAKQLDHFTEIIELCRKGLAAGPSKTDDLYIRRLLGWAYNRRGEAYVDRATVAADKGETKQAEKLEALALADFEDAVKNDPRAWKAIHNRGVSYAQLTKFEQAIVQFDKVISLNPEFANAWFNRGELYYELGKFEKALADYSKALKLKPDDIGIYTSLGHAYFQLKQFQQALANYDRAVDLDKKSAEAYIHRADAYQSLGKWREAAADYRRGIELDDQLGQAFQSAAWLMATCPDKRFRNTELAIQAAHKAIKLDGESALNLDVLAAALASAAQYKQAETTLVKAILLAGDIPKQRFQTRLKLYQQGKPYRQAAPTKAKKP